jgi:hypothetical protein
VGWDIIEVIERNMGKSVSLIIFVGTGLILLKLDQFLFYKKRDEIIAICEQFSKKRRIIGQIKYWLYIVLTILLFWCVFRLYGPGYYGSK